MNGVDADSFAYFLLDRGYLDEVPDFLPKDNTHYVINQSDIDSIPKDKERIHFVKTFKPSLKDNMFDWREVGWNRVTYIHLGEHSLGDLQHVIFSGNTFLSRSLIYQHRSS